MTTIRNTDPGHHWAWRGPRGRFVSRAVVLTEQLRAVGLVFAAICSERVYGQWPTIRLASDLQDRERNKALFGLPVALGAQPARRGARVRAAQTIEAFGLNQRRTR